MSTVESPVADERPEPSAADEPPANLAAEEPAPRRFPTVWVAISIVVGLLLGYAAGLLTPLLRTPGDTSPEAGFARDMAVHHAQAVEMSMIIYGKTTNPDIRDLAFDIVTNQQGQIGIMNRWLEEWRLSPTGSQPRMAWMPEGRRTLENGLMPGMATTAQINALHQATGKEADILYAQLLLRHHLGGIHMVGGVLDLADRPEVLKLAQTMRNGQQGEVGILKDLLDEMGAKPL